MTKQKKTQCQHTVCPSDRGSGFYGDPPRQCERTAEDGSKYCWQHKPLHTNDPERPND